MSLAIPDCILKLYIFFIQFYFDMLFWQNILPFSRHNANTWIFIISFSLLLNVFCSLNFEFRLSLCSSLVIAVGCLLRTLISAHTQTEMYGRDEKKVRHNILLAAHLIDSLADILTSSFNLHNPLACPGLFTTVNICLTKVELLYSFSLCLFLNY